MPAKTKTPLRYPGGKVKLKNYLCDLINCNNFNNYTYVEAFAGGAGLAMELLITGKIKNVILNDIDKSIFSLWDSILNNKDELVSMIKKNEITIDEWNKQKNIQNNKEQVSKIDLAYSTLFLNRTNRSGILKAGPIGGKNQNGNYLLDCRFNRDDIIERIEKIHEFRNSIEFYNLDAVDFISMIEARDDKMFVFFDPPYFNKGPELYVNYYKKEDHEYLAKKITQIEIPWIITYDNEEHIKDIYKDFNQTVYYLNYSVQNPHKGKEVMIYSDNVKSVEITNAY